MSGPRRGFGSIRRLPSGRYQAFYNDPDGRTTTSRTGKTTPVRHAAPSTFTTALDAEAWLTDERRLISAGTWTPPSRRKAARRARHLTFGEYARAWLDQRKVKGKPLAARTRDHYADLLDRFINPTFEHLALRDITEDQVEAWHELTAIDLPTTRAHAYSLLRTILGTAVERGLIPANPAHIRGAGSTERARKIRTATVPEVATIVAAMPERQRLMITLATWCALRFGELVELRRSDVDTKRSIIKVRRAVVRARGEQGRTTTLVKGPKTTAGTRDVVVPPHVLDDLREHLLQHTAPGKDGLLFPSPGGGHLAPSTFYGKAASVDAEGRIVRRGRGYYEARRQAGRDDLNFHALRHTGLTNAATVGATLAELMAMAGHSSPAAAMRYQHASRDRMSELAAKMSALANDGVR